MKLPSGRSVHVDLLPKTSIFSYSLSRMTYSKYLGDHPSICSRRAASDQVVQSIGCDLSHHRRLVSLDRLHPANTTHPQTSHHEYAERGYQRKERPNCLHAHYLDRCRQVLRLQLWLARFHCCLITWQRRRPHDYHVCLRSVNALHWYPYRYRGNLSLETETLG